MKLGRTVGERVDFRIFALFPVDTAQARQGVLTVDVHSARATDPFTARPTEGQSWVDFVLDFDERVQNLNSVSGLNANGHVTVDPTMGPVWFKSRV